MQKRVHVSAHEVRVNGALLDRYRDTVFDHGELGDGTVVVWTGDSVGRHLHVYRFDKERLISASHETLVGDGASRITVAGDGFSITIGGTVFANHPKNRKSK